MVTKTNASQIAFTPSGTGAVPTTVKQVLDESVSVFRFMTEAQIADVKAGTLAFDMTAAIQEAINSLPLNTADVGVLAPLGFANGGTIKLPRGRYKITGALSLRRGLNLVGEGRESTQLVSFTTGSVLQYLDAGRYIQDEIAIKRLSIWQDSSVTPTSGAAIEIVDGPATVDSVAPTISDVLIVGTYHGILLSAGVGGSVRGSNVSKCVSHNIFLKYSAGSYEKTTSTTFYNTYSHQSQTGSGYYFENGNYVSVVGGGSDSNARYGYEMLNGTAYAIAGGAEANTLGGVYAKNTRGLELVVDIYDTPSNSSDAVTLDTTFGTTISGVLHTGTGSTGYGIKQIATGGPVVLSNLSTTGDWVATKFTNSDVQLLQIGAVANGFLGGIGKRWAFGATSSPATSVQLGVSGTADTGVTTGQQVDPVFVTAGTSNSAEATQVKTADTAVTYALAIAKYIKNASKGAASTITRLCGIAIEDQTAGGTANANIMLGGTTPAAGTWNIFSQSTRESVWYGRHRFVSSTGPILAFGTGSPEGAIAAPVGSMYGRTDGGAGTSFYVKESGTGNTGWVAK